MVLVEFLLASDQTAGSFLFWGHAQRPLALSLVLEEHDDDQVPP
jgi:hypothetical protein